MKIKFSIWVIFISFVQSTNATTSDVQNENLQASNFRPKYFAFEAKSLFGGSSQDIDLTKFSLNNGVASGDYSLHTHINNERNLGQLTLKFVHFDESQEVELCVDVSLLNRLDFKKNILEKLLLILVDKPCLNISELAPEAKYELDYENLRINLVIPLILLNERPRGYIAPEVFDKGVTSAFVAYQFNHYRSEYNSVDERSNTLDRNYLQLNAGLNVNGFNYRHAGNFNNGEQKLGQYTSWYNILSTDILPLNARLNFGDFQTQPLRLDSAKMVGVELATDRHMRPNSLRSFAPKIQGYAKSNALVTVYQEGRKIFERTVPAGAFEFTDLMVAGSSGELTVEITENDGEVYRSNVPLQSSINLLRVGQINYQIAAGRYKFNQKISDDFISQMSMEYGFNNYLSMYSGANVSELFQSYLLGIMASTYLGGLSADVEHADATALRQDLKGQRLRMNYQIYFKDLNSVFNVSAHMQSREYLALGTAMQLKNYGVLTALEIDQLLKNYRLKSQWRATLYQTLPKREWGNLSFSSSILRYWDQLKNYTQYSLAYSNHWNKLNYSIGYSYLEDYIRMKPEKRVYLSLSMPLGGERRRVNMNSNVQHSNQERHPTTYNVGLSGLSGQNNQMNYGFYANYVDGANNANQRASVSGNINYNLPQVRLGASMGWSALNRQYSLSAHGALVAHPYGLTANNTLSDTFTIIHTDHAKGADLVYGSGSKVDSFGNVIYTSISPYDVNTISLDISKLPVDVRLLSNQAEVIPRRYSSTLLKFESKKTSNILLNVKVDDGTQIPIGVEATGLDGQIVGMFGQSNQLFVEDTELLKHPMEVMWGATEVKKCRIAASDHLIKEQKNANLFQMIHVECKK